MSNIRPDLKRDGIRLLNGLWDFGYNDGREEVFDKKINVPFSPETVKSKVGHTLLPSETSYYRLMVPLKKKEKKRYLLTFMAVDYYATLFINGKNVLKHEGGYLPFSTDITDYISDGGFEIKLYVKDPSDTSYIERGKQSLKPHRIWYPAQSGIWGDVYLEEVEEDYIEKIIVTPDYDNSSFSILAVSNKRDGEKIEIEIAGKKIEAYADSINIIKIENAHPWSPDDPYIYYFKIRYKDDSVESYTALRKFSLSPDSSGNKRFELNNKAIFHHGVLDQGYMKESLMTYDSEDAIIKDLEAVKAMGFNMVRKHIKIESPLWYYHATRLGLLVWQDMVSGGSGYNEAAITLPLFIGSFLKDKKSYLLSRRSKEEKKKYESFIKESINYLYSVPCIALWCIFNEGWGQFESSRILEEIKEIDSTRAIDIVSGWHDQGDGDFLSKHVYFMPYRFKKDKKGRCVILSEFGGVGMGEEKTEAKKFTYKEAKSEEELIKEIEKMYERDVIPYIEKGLSASVYTQLSDVEQETNGLLSYDRKRIKVPIDRMKAISRKVLKAIH